MEIINIHKNYITMNKIISKMWDSISKVNLITDSLIGITTKQEENIDLLNHVKLKNVLFENIMINLSESIKQTLSRQFIESSDESLLNNQSDDIFKYCSQI